MFDATAAAITGYLRAALFTGTDDDDRPLDGSFTLDDFSPDALDSAVADVGSFLTETAPILPDTMEPDDIGINLWFSRNGHGTGFWDGGLGEVGETLHGIAAAMGEAVVEIGDDGKLYILSSSWGG